MRWSKFFIPTLREDPSEAEIISHKFLLRAGMIRKLASGIYNFLPLGFKALKKIENIVRCEMNKAGALEILMPLFNQQNFGRKPDVGMPMERTFKI
jgi:Prolyl-tRNA synthetase